ncbi:hypothetical protein EMIHUDRAFT_457412 [Emiliania huxleyi CCMP1516]|uniref:Uncharacterized protein n=2 Tax=Emiliania huxleyi TaxID=2903 RepID=A0A0D3JRI9_EMIH1|nr:hypothetical protein EMIHUDRAFT_457412 [Emiliania huxleyi CCMP1516]EOD26124.1 hypothetical protein EMIHUDRAFT_457412 [Emiliania huxleyi CCMP1516]|eukprot:XP_005778553.1 hypothetical protein EMIHUDRAFT_457412 [Emiliania huxleyi CCMP1516]
MELALLSTVALSLSAVQPAPGLMKLRGGMSLGPLNPGNFEGGMKVAAAITAAGAVTSKYADVGETQLTKLFSGDVWNTNLIISIVTGVTSTVVYSVGGSAFDAAKLTAVLWAVGLLSKLKNNNFDVGTLKDNPVETVVAAAAAYLAFA